MPQWFAASDVRLRGAHLTYAGVRLAIPNCDGDPQLTLSNDCKTVTIQLAAFPGWQRNELVPDLLKAAPEVTVLQQPPPAWFDSAKVVLSASGDIDHDEGEAYCTSQLSGRTI